MSQPTRLFPLRLGVLLVSAAALGCGPELTDAGTSDLTGVWEAQQPIGLISNVELQLAFDEGDITGTWSGTLTGPPPACPPDLGTPLKSIVYGKATVTTVEFQMLGVGQYVGALRSPTRLEGRIDSCYEWTALNFELISREVPP